MKNCTGINCPMQYGVVDSATCSAAYCCPNATPPITNADRIRAMTDEELAEWLEEHCYQYGWLDWLRQEATE